MPYYTVILGADNAKATLHREPCGWHSPGCGARGTEATSACRPVWDPSSVSCTAME